MKKYFFLCTLADARVTESGVLDVLADSLPEARERIKEREASYTHCRDESWTRHFSKRDFEQEGTKR